MAASARATLAGGDQRLRSENVQKVGPLSWWIILFGISAHKLRSVSGRRPNPHLLGLCFSLGGYANRQMRGRFQKRPFISSLSAVERRTVFIFIYLFFLEVHRPPAEAKPGNEQKRIPTRSCLIPADHRRHILDLVEFDFTWIPSPLLAAAAAAASQLRSRQRRRANCRRWLIEFLAANGPRTPLVMKCPGVYYWQFETITFLTAGRRGKSDCRGASGVRSPHELVGDIFFFHTRSKERGKRKRKRPPEDCKCQSCTQVQIHWKCSGALSSLSNFSAPPWVKIDGAFNLVRAVYLCCKNKQCCRVKYADFFNRFQVFSCKILTLPWQHST